MAFGLQITRQASNDVIVCQSGGFVASGEVSIDKSPTCFLPQGLTPLGGEGFGEVQTPLQLSAVLKSRWRYKLGDPVFFRPAKAGEIAERFNEYLLVRRQKGDQNDIRYTLIETAKTYRGLGFNFF